VRIALAFAIVAAATGVAEAHKPSDAHLRLSVAGSALVGQLSIAVRDLDGALALDADGNGDITWAEVTAARPRIVEYVQKRLLVTTADGPCTLAYGAPALVDLTDGAYWTVAVTGDCGATPDALDVSYALLFDIDAQHRGIVHVEAPGSAQTVVVRSAKPVTIRIADPTATFALLATGARALPVLALLALAALLLGAWRSGRVRPREMAELVGAFACAEAASCLLVAAGDLVLPWEWVARGIAAVVVIGAVAGVVRRTVGGALRVELGAVAGFAVAHALDLAALPTHTPTAALAFAVGAIGVQVGVAAIVTGALSWRVQRRG
jgi:hypothetical protein